ncbi:hypothetical protein C8F01DRAFT_1253596 [Mycena amicta]|nr:hypothetical protein C8F01DRAFT_1253596 [Mycena amicta]
MSSSNASSQRPRTRERVTELEELVVQLQRQITALELRFSAPEPTASSPSVPAPAHPPTATASGPAPKPVQASVAASPTPTSVLSPPSSSFPSSSSSSLTTGPSTPVSATPDGVYVYSSRAQPPAQMTSWAEAHAGSQGGLGGHAQRIDSSPTKRKSPRAYYVVFRGHEIGVFHKNWPREIDANTAFENAQRHGYTSNQAQPAGQWAVALDQMPLPVPHDDPEIVGEERLLGRFDEEPWYVVFKGANPGFFPTYIEAALNTSGISSNGHLSKPTFVDALITFRTAQRRWPDWPRHRVGVNESSSRPV